VKNPNKLINRMQIKGLMGDDEEIIDYFLNNQGKFTPCPFTHKAIANMEKIASIIILLKLRRRQMKKLKLRLMECVICLEKVLKNGKQFGILDGCDHTFCLNCIRNWRSTYDKRAGKHHLGLALFAEGIVT